MQYFVEPNACEIKLCSVSFWISLITSHRILHSTDRIISKAESRIIQEESEKEDKGFINEGNQKKDLHKDSIHFLGELI